MTSIKATGQGTKIKIQGVEYGIPAQPPIELIDGYALPKEEQKWRRTELPTFAPEDTLIVSGVDYPGDYRLSWEEMRREELIIQTGFDPEAPTRQRIYREFNPFYINQQAEDFRRQEWNRILNGFWFMNCGVATYLTGTNYFFLNYWCMDTGYASYRETDRDLFYFWEAVKHDDALYGLIEITKRGQGKSYRAGCIAYYECITHFSARVGMQSKSDDDASDLFLNKIVEPYKTLPDFLVPIHNHSPEPKSKLSFFPKREQAGSKKKALRSYIDFKASGELGYDSATLKFLIQDEVAKCLKKNTGVRMFDGTVKMVQDIVPGEGLMGENSHKKTVRAVSSGQEMCYDIIPKKGGWGTYGCNESHILSLKWCLAHSALIHNGVKYLKGDTVNMSVKEYLTKSGYVKKHLMLYKVGVEYKEQSHTTPPYLLGAWLGDGTTKSTAIHVAGSKNEIAAYMNRLAQETGAEFRITEHKKNMFLCRIIAPSGKAMFSLGNKKTTEKIIPQSYLIDSRKNRLALLAGIIDTDGHASSGSRNYTVVQKRELLANQINELAMSLGFSSSVKETVATMRRKNGSVYSCPIWKVIIFGDNLHEVPCLVVRKQFEAVVNRHKNTRSPLRCGFKVKQTGVETYYGFTLGGNHLFLLADYQVTHNTNPDLVNVAKRLTKNLDTVYRDSKMIGKIYCTSTVEEMDKGGEPAFDIWRNSNQGKRNELGRTPSGLVRFFTSALDCTYFDEFGRPDRIRAKRFHDIERASRLHDTLLWVAYVQKNPYTIDEAFMISNDDAVFNMKILNERRRLCTEVPACMIGRLEWIDREKTKVKFIKDPKGHWHISYLPTAKEMNAIQVGMEIVNNQRTISRSPLNQSKYQVQYDPFSHGTTSFNTRRSNAGITVRKLYDFWCDPEFSQSFVADYVYRPANPEVAHEEMFKACVLYGAESLIESQKNAVIEMAYRWGFGEFVMKRPSITFAATSRNNQNSATDGVPASTNFIILSTELLQKDVVTNGWKYRHLRIIEDLIHYKPEERTKFDLAVCCQLAVVGEVREIATEANENPYGDGEQASFDMNKMYGVRQEEDEGSVDVGTLSSIFG